MVTRKKMSIALATAVILAYVAAHYFKVNAIVGSAGRMFSLSNCLLPLIGAFVGMGASFAYAACNLGVRLLLLPWVSLIQPCLGMPTLAASCYWATDRVWVKAGLPLVCMMLFIAHPVGFAAMPYSFYWLLPIAIAFYPRKNHFLIALASTLSAHAIGSVIYLYTINAMQPAAWYALIPVVACERLIFASGMYIAYTVIEAALVKTSVLLASEDYTPLR